MSSGIDTPLTCGSRLLFRRWKLSAVAAVAHACLSLAVFAQPQIPPDESVIVRGRILDAISGSPMEYANVVLLAAADTSVVTGMATGGDGRFEFRNILHGEYLLDVRLIGFEDKRLPITVRQSDLDLGTIRIARGDISLQEIRVRGERSAVTYQIDKKVIDVGQMPIVASGTAADVLENIPSVSVDIDGNVSLRGSTSFTVLIDGRPTVLDAQDALQQIPATAIDHIEIITNPSAKYDPEGSSGIVNIIMKKDLAKGIGGLASLDAGSNETYGGDLLVEYKTESVTVTGGFDHSNRVHPGTEAEQRTTVLDGETTYQSSSGDRTHERNALGARGGVELRLGPHDALTLGGRYGNRSHKRRSTVQLRRWSTGSTPTENRNHSTTERTRDYYAFNGSYLHTFGPQEHELSGNFIFGYRDATDETLTEVFDNSSRTSGRHSTEFGPSHKLDGRLDYVLPITEQTRFETGYEGEYDNDEEGNGLYELSLATGVYELLPQFSHLTNSLKSEHALYSTYRTQWGSFGAQAGLRAEHTYRRIRLNDIGQEFTVNRTDYFPSIHSSYRFSSGTQIMASYTRRIDRPRGWYLEPFDTWDDANNVRRGNPALEPEYFDSYEAGLQTIIGGASLSSELYYRVNNNKIERIRSVYSENVTLTTFANVGNDASLGGEFLVNVDALKEWNINLLGNLYHYRVEGVLFDQQFSKESFNWRARISNTVKLPSATQFQLTVGYESPTVSAQGRHEAVYSSDVAARQDLLSKALSVTLQVRDLFTTAKHERVSEGLGFYSVDTFTRRSPTVLLNIKFNLNNYKEDRRRSEAGDFDDE